MGNSFYQYNTADLFPGNLQCAVNGNLSWNQPSPWVNIWPYQLIPVTWYPAYPTYPCQCDKRCEKCGGIKE